MRRRKSELPSEVRTNLTAALDIIFNILAFFVVTYNPPSPEQNFDVSLPPPKKQEEQAEGNEEIQFIDEELEDPVEITLIAGGNGTLASAAVGGTSVQPLRLGPEIQRQIGVLRGSGLEADRATIYASPNLQYGYIIEAVDALQGMKLNSVGFGDLPGS